MTSALPPSHSFSTSSPLEQAVEYIRNHYDDDIRLEELARIAGLSKFHFHRLFRARTGETVQKYIKRMRLEKAILMMQSADHCSITRIAYACGFSSSQNFTRIFKSTFGVPPTLYCRASGGKQTSFDKFRNIKYSDKQNSFPLFKMETERSAIKSAGSSENQELEVVQLPAYKVAYMQTTVSSEANEIPAALKRLVQWASQNKLLTDESLLLGVIRTEEAMRDQLLYSVSVTVPVEADVDAPDDIAFGQLPEGAFCVYHGRFRQLSDVAGAWKELYGNWRSSIYDLQKDRPSYEIYYNDGRINPAGTWFVDLCLPVAIHCGNKV